MHIPGIAFSALSIYYKHRKYAFSESLILKLNMKIQSADCNTQALKDGFFTQCEKMKM